MLFLAPGQHQLLQSPGEEHLGLLPYAVSTCSKLLAFHCIGKEVGFSAKKACLVSKFTKSIIHSTPTCNYLPLLSPEVAILLQTNSSRKDHQQLGIFLGPICCIDPS